MQRPRKQACSSVWPITLWALLFIGCGSAAQRDATTPDQARRLAKTRTTASDLPYSDVVVHADAQVIQLDCEHSTYEECNALDDDCNGIIDDQCGYEGGAIQITVGWNSGADIDLYVTDPSGATLYYNELHKRSNIGGHLDHDARGDCRREQQNPRIENIYWPSPAHAGRYRVELRYFSPCARASTTDATVSVAVSGELLGSYRYRLEPEQRIEALSFVKR